MKIFSWNVNGIRAVINKGNFQQFLNQFSPDILLMQETKIDEPALKAAKIRELFPEYDQFYSFALKKGYSGTAVWVKKSLNLTPKLIENDTKNDNLSDKYGDLQSEGRLTILELDDFCVASVYVPNTKGDLSRLEIRQNWDKCLAETLKNLNRPVIIGGDFNVANEPIDLARPKENDGKHGYTKEERQGFKNLLQSANLLDSFRKLHPETVKYSWWSHWGHARANNIGWRIDYFLISNQLKKGIKSAEIYSKCLGSDHCPILIEIENHGH
jgi:exodeoxyribonuclease-3